jgi:DNA processing protein
LNSHDAYVVLNLLTGIGPLRVKQLLTIFETPERLFQVSQSELARVSGIGPVIAEVIHHWQAHCEPEHEIALAEKAGVALITPADQAYPTLLSEIHDPPLCLYVRGNPDALNHPNSSIAIVGTRRASHYGQRTAAMLARSAANAGWNVISGLARGIDTAAHQATVQANGSTVAVLGSGLAHLYPQENLALARQIVESGGAVISEYPLNYPPDKRTFPMRNRIIAGLSRGTIVVEAGQRSGALITATQALEQGRQVFAVPGCIDTPQCKGCHGLLKDGAALVESFSDILAEFAVEASIVPADRAAKTASKPAKTGSTNQKNTLGNLQLSDIESKICAFVEKEDVSIDELISHLQDPPHKILSAVVTLEMRHLVRQLPGRRLTRQAGSQLA